MTAATRAAIARANTRTCACGATAVSVGCHPHGWIVVAQRGGPHRSAWCCSWACAARLAAGRAA